VGIRLELARERRGLLTLSLRDREGRAAGDGRGARHGRCSPDRASQPSRLWEFAQLGDMWIGSGDGCRCGGSRGRKSLGTTGDAVTAEQKCLVRLGRR
jgi:hypothetical protein